MKSSPTSTFHIYLTLDKKFGERVSSLSQKIYSTHKSNFVVGTDYLPHLTLYLFAAPLRNRSLMIDAVKRLEKEIKAKSFACSDMIYTDDGWLMVNINSEKLADYHKSCIKLVNPLREGVLRKKYRNSNEVLLLPKNERESLEKYGDRHAMRHFHAHVSVSEFHDTDVGLAVYQKYKDHFKGMGTEIKELRLVQVTNENSGGVGRILYNKKLI